MKRFLPGGITVLYAIFYLAVLANNLFWPVGDQTDVIRVGVAAAPLGVLVSLAYPGGRNDAFLAVTVCACINAIALYYIVRWLTRSKVTPECR